MTAAVQQTLDTRYLPVDQVVPNPHNVRSELGDLAELIDSIRRHGIQQPALVYPDPDGDGWVLIAGHRRHAAAIAAGLDEIPAVVREEPDQVTLLELMLAENGQRADLDPIDEAKALLAIKAAGGYRRLEQIAAGVGRSKEWVARRLSLVSGLPEDLWPAVSARQVSLADAERVAKLKVPVARKRELFQKPELIAQEERHAAREKQRADLEAEYGLLTHVSQLGGIRQANPWGIIRLGDSDGQLNVAVPMHRGCEGHIAVEQFDGNAHAYCTRPLAHVTAGDIDADIPDGATPLVELFTSWNARRAHENHCAGHQDLVLPWERVAVCLTPDVHGDQFNEAALEQLHAADQAGRKPGESIQDAPRWQVSPEAHELLTQRITELVDAAPLFRDLVAIGWVAPHDVAGELVEQIEMWLRSLGDGEPGSWDPTVQTDQPTVDAVLFGLQACIDAGAPPPNLDQIRTRIDVITRGEQPNDTEEGA